MQKKFAAFDIDGTLVRWQLYHAIVDELVKNGDIKPESYKAVKMARMSWKKRTEPDAFKKYERQLVDAYKKALTRLPVENFEKAVSKVFEEYKDQVYTYTRDLIKQLKEDGYILFAISGSQTEIVKLIADYYGFDDYIGTTYEKNDSHFSGKAKSHIGEKHIILSELAQKHGASHQDSIALGDSMGDLTMLESVEKPIAFNPKMALLEHAKKHNWPIIIERKNVIYNLDGKDGKYVLV